MQAVPGQSGISRGMNVPLHDYTVVPKDCGHCRKIYSRFRQMGGEVAEIVQDKIQSPQSQLFMRGANPILCSVQPLHVIIKEALGRGRARQTYSSSARAMIFLLSDVRSRIL